MGLKRFFVNFGTYHLSQIIASGFQFFWVIYLANAVGSEEYGKYATAVAFVAMFGSLLDFGMELVVIRDVARQRHTAAKYLAGLAVWHLLLNLLVGGIVLTGAWLLRFRLEMVVLIGLFYGATALNNLAMVGPILLQALEKFALIGLLSIIQVSVLIFFGLLALSLGYGLVGIFSVYLIVAALHLPLVCFVTLRLMHRIEFGLDRGFFFYLFSEAAPLGMVAFFSTVYFRVDKVILAKMTGLAEVGWYSAAFVLMQACMDLIWSNFNKIIYPVLSRASSGDGRALSKLTESLVRVFAAILSFVSIAVFFLSDTIVSLVYRSSDFERAGDALRVLCWLAIPTILWAIYRNVLLVRGKPWVYAAITGWGMVLNISLNVILIKEWGWIGAAYASIMTQLSLLAITYVYIHKTFGNMLPLRAFAKIALVGALLGIAMWWLRRDGSDLIALPALSLGYAALMAMTGTINRSDLTTIRRML